MGRAYAHLRLFKGWRRITIGGPKLLPPSSGAVRAFKFRDPDGHPLELLWLPSVASKPAGRDSITTSPFLRIDHSAISVHSTSISLSFYGALGFRTSHRSSNQGVAQSRLDGMEESVVRVTRLDPGSASSAGLELLAYCPAGRTNEFIRVTDTVTDWMTLGMSESSEIRPHAMQDPDHHRLLLVDQGEPRGESTS
jgi:catechol 2,3-dioxygenase-like lactoylglutathione lyase family enzyme